MAQGVVAAFRRAPGVERQLGLAGGFDGRPVLDRHVAVRGPDRHEVLRNDHLRARRPRRQRRQEWQYETGAHALQEVAAVDRVVSHLGPSSVRVPGPAEEGRSRRRGRTRDVSVRHRPQLELGQQRRGLEHSLQALRLEGGFQRVHLARVGRFDLRAAMLVAVVVAREALAGLLWVATIELSPIASRTTSPSPLSRRGMLVVSTRARKKASPASSKRTSSVRKRPIASKLSDGKPTGLMKGAWQPAQAVPLISVIAWVRSRVEKVGCTTACSGVAMSAGATISSQRISVRTRAPFRIGCESKSPYICSAARVRTPARGCESGKGTGGLLPPRPGRDAVGRSEG